MWYKGYCYMHPPPKVKEVRPDFRLRSGGIVLAASRRPLRLSSLPAWPARRPVQLAGRSASVTALTLPLSLSLSPSLPASLPLSLAHSPIHHLQMFKSKCSCIQMWLNLCEKLVLQIC